MAIGSGIGASLGIAAESTYGTYVTPSRFYEFTDESLEYEKETVASEGLRAGGFMPRVQRRLVTAVGGTGDLTMDLPTKGLGLLLNQALGSVTVAQQGGTTAYLQTHTLGDLAGKSFTAQVGVPRTDGTVIPKTLLGCKVASFELACAAGELASATFSIDARDVVSNQTLATPSYSPTTGLFSFLGGTVRLDGTAIAAIGGASVSVDNGLKTDRRFFGGSGRKSEPIIADWRTVEGSLDAEFTADGATLMDRYMTDTTVAIVLEFVGATISGSFSELLRVTMPACKFNGSSASVGGPDVVTLDMGFTAFDNGSGQPITVEYQSTDLAV
jgi:hypothetical protein